MIDTIILTIPYGSFEIIDHTKFMPNTINFNYGSFVRAMNNPPKAEQKWNYKPRMTLYKRADKQGQQIELRIEFSAPKILYNNNLDELEQKDFIELINLLHEKMKSRGVLITKKYLKTAPVSSFHPSKNIQLLGYYTVSFIVGELSKVDLTKRLDLTKTPFIAGHSLQYYSNSHSLVFYDKIADLNRPKGRAIDKDKTGLQLELFRSVKEMRRYDHLEILKMEVRLSKKQKMNSVLEKLGYEKNPNLKQIFNKKLCQTVLKDYWQTLIEEKNKFLYNLPEKDIGKELDIILDNSDKKFKEALCLLGLKMYIQEKGVSELRIKIEDKRGKNSWARFPHYLKELNKIAEKRGKKSKVSYIKDIERALNEFEPIKSKILTDPLNYADYISDNCLV